MLQIALRIGDRSTQSMAYTEFSPYLRVNQAENGVSDAA